MFRSIRSRAALASLAAALSFGAASVSASPVALDAAAQERVTALGFEVERLSALDAERQAEIAALIEAGHDDEALRREIGAILESDAEGYDSSQG